MKKISILFLVAVLLLSMVVGVRDASAADKKINLKIGTGLTAGHPYVLAMELMKKRFEESGRFTVNLFIAGQLGSERELIEMCQLGTLDIAVVGNGVMANFTDAYMVFDLPFLFKDYAHVHKACDSEIGQGIMDTIKSKGLIGLAIMDAGWMAVQTRTKPVLNPEDLKGLKIRTQESPMMMAFFTVLGANPVPVPFNEVYTVLQNGTVDGAQNPLNVIYAMKHYEPARYLTGVNGIFSPANMVMSKAKMESLPADLQKLIRDVSNEAKVYERQLIQNADEKAIKQMEAEGAKYYPVPDREAWVKAVVKPVYTQILPTLSPENRERVKRIQAMQ